MTAPLLPAGDPQALRWQNPSLLTHLDRARKPWDALARRVVQAVVRKFAAGTGGPLVEIGAGGGQLRDWLPPEAAAVTTHTERSEPYVRELRRRHPDAAVARADAAALPWDDARVAGVLGLCVFDALPDLPAVRDECRRVLRPGGVVIHVLDLGTNPDAAFEDLLAGGEVPLTNFAHEPSLRAALKPAKLALLPACDEFDEVIAAGELPFARLLAWLRSLGHSLPDRLGPYSHLHEPGPRDPFRLGQDFMAVRSDPARLLAVNRALLALTFAAREARREWPLRPVSLREHLRARLRAAFSRDEGFEVEFAGPVAAWEPAAAGAPLSPGCRVLLRHAGRTVPRASPTPWPGTPVEELEGVPLRPPPGEPVRVTTVEVFVARRTA